jgi:hypothetical protein
MNTSRLSIVLAITLLLFLAAWGIGTQNGAPSQAQLQAQANEQVSQCANRTDDLKLDVSPSGATIGVRSGARIFLSLPRTLYPEPNMQLDTTMFSIASMPNGEIFNHKKDSCWTHYYELRLQKGLSSGSGTLTFLSNDLGLPDYILHVVVTK